MNSKLSPAHSTQKEAEKENESKQEEWEKGNKDRWSASEPLKLDIFRLRCDEPDQLARNTHVPRHANPCLAS